jgi:ATP-binding cassette, subfamily F, member 2
VARELWEVENKKIKDLTKVDITIVDYKKNLIKQSMYLRAMTVLRSLINHIALGYAAIEKAKLFSKSAPKGRS